MCSISKRDTQIRYCSAMAYFILVNMLKLRKPTSRHPV